MEAEEFTPRTGRWGNASVEDRRVEPFITPTKHLVFGSCESYFLSTAPVLPKLAASSRTAILRCRPR